MTDIYILTELDDAGVRRVLSTAITSADIEQAARQRINYLTDGGLKLERTIDIAPTIGDNIYKAYWLQPQTIKSADYKTIILELRHDVKD